MATCNFISIRFLPGPLAIFLLFFASLNYGQNAGSSSPAEIMLPPGAPVEGSITSGEMRRFRIDLPANRTVGIEFDQKGIDLSVRVTAPGGQTLSLLNSRSRKSETMEYVTVSKGSYFIELICPFRNQSGAFSIKVTDLREVGDSDRIRHDALNLMSTSASLTAVDRHAEALPPIAQAVEMVERSLGSEERVLGQLLFELGYVQRNLGNLKEAEAVLKRALVINERAFGPESYATIGNLRLLGIVYDRADNIEKSEQFLDRALALTEKTYGPEHPFVIPHLISLSAFYNDRPDFARSEKALDRGIALGEKFLPPENEWMADMLNNLALLYVNTGRVERAEKMYRQVLAIHEKAGRTETAAYSNTMQNLGVIFRERKEYGKALEFYERALPIREKILGNDHVDVAALLNNIATVHRSKGDLAKAIEIQSRVLDISNRRAGPYGGMTLLSTGNIARVYAAMGDTANLIKYQKLHDERIETLVGLQGSIGSVRQREMYFDNLAFRTDRTISYHVKNAPNDKAAAELALQVIFQRKGRLVDALAESSAAFRERANAGDQKLFDELNTKTAQLAKFIISRPPGTTNEEFLARIEALEREKEDLESRIGSIYTGFRLNTLPVTLDAVRNAIPPDAALIEFVVYSPFDANAENNSLAYGKPRYLAYVTGRDGDIKWKDIGDAAEVNAAIDEFRRSLADAKSVDLAKTARLLDERVMRPLRELIGGRRHLLLSPDGHLNLIPFEALVDENGKYLIENYAFSYLTSGRDLLRMGNNGVAKANPLIIADPAFGDTGGASVADRTTAKKRNVTIASELSKVYFAPLAGTGSEGASIKRLFPEAVYLSDLQATETAVKKFGSPKMLHIATHGFYLQSSEAKEAGKKSLPENPLLRSGLAFAGANTRPASGDDGILTSLEASGLNLFGTKLVVLSACGTGLGEVRNGDGVYGLRRSFLIAGAESLVFSLWPVSDNVTRELMTGYYKNLRQGLGRGESLRRVQLEMLKRPSRKHPFSWASFIQAGEWANLDGKR